MIRWLLYIFCISLTSFYSIKKPEYNWDMLGYMALVLRVENKNIEETHLMTYENAKEQIPAEFYFRLTDSANAYRRKMKENAVEFYRQLPFYTVNHCISYLYTCFTRLGLRFLYRLFYLPFLRIFLSAFCYSTGFNRLFP